MLFVGDCKSGKTTITYNLCHSQDLDLVVNHPSQPEEYYSSSSYFLAGCHPIHETVKLHSSPEFYMKKWIFMDKDRPKYFIDDGLRFVDELTYNNLLDAGVHVYIFKITANLKDIKDRRLHHDSHICTNSVINLPDTFNTRHPQVTTTEINTSTTTSYVAILQICELLGTQPHWKLHFSTVQKIENSIYGFDCPVYKKLLPPKVSRQIGKLHD